MKKNIKSQNLGHNKGKFKKEDEVILHALEPVVDNIAEAIGSNCEVVLHNLADFGHSIVKIANGHVTGRKVGGPFTGLGIEILKEAESPGKDVANSYYNRLESGKLLKSSASVIRNAEGKPIAMICINIDLSIPMADFLREFVPKDSEYPKREVEHFTVTTSGLVSSTLEMVMTRVSNLRQMSPSDKNKRIVKELYLRGIFDIRGAIDVVAKQIGVSRYTVYNYLREAKVEAREEMHLPGSESTI